MKDFLKMLWIKFGESAAALGIITAGMICGTYFGPYFYELSKLNTKNQISAIKAQIDSVNTLIDSDTLNYKNWMANHTTPIQFSPSQGPNTFLSIGNFTTQECEFIKDNVCIGKWVKAKGSDILLVQIEYKNQSKIDVRNVIIKLDFDIDSIKQESTVYGKLLLGNHVFLSDSVKIFATHTYIMGIGEILAIEESKKIKQLKSSAIISDYGINVGSIKPDSSKTISLSIRMSK